MLKELIPKHMFRRCLLVDKSEISQQLEPWCCPPFRNHYNRSHVGMKQFTPQIVAKSYSNSLLNVALCQILRYFCRSLYPKMGAPDSKNPPPLENLGRHYR
jgi:hypothetical protein